MVIYLYGPDSYRRQQKQKEIIEEYKAKHSNLTFDRFYLDEDDEFSRLKEFSLNQSLFGDFKLGIIYNLSAASNQEDLVGLIKSHLESKNSHLILSADKHLGKEFAFLLKKPVLSQEFSALSSVDLSNFIKAEAKKRNLTISPEVIRNLTQIYQTDTWGLINELDKISLGGKIETPYQYRKEQFFDLIGGILNSPSVASRLKTLEVLLDNEDSAMLFNFVASFSRGVQKIKMADYDAMIKSGKLNYEEALLDLSLT